MLIIVQVYIFTCDEDCGEWSGDYIPAIPGRGQLKDAIRQAEVDGWSFEPMTNQPRRRPKVRLAYFIRCPAHAAVWQERLRPT